MYKAKEEMLMLLLVTPSCGSRTSENCTYLDTSSSTIPSNGICEYTICKCSADVCRIRLDFVVSHLRY